jgi:hypothetical protein
MAGQQTSSQTLQSIAGSVLAGLGAFVLRGTLDEAAAQLSQFRGSTSGEGLGLLHFVMLAASLNHQQLVQDLLQIFFAFWPLLPVIVGAGLLCDAFMNKSQDLGPCDSGPSRVNESLVFWQKCMPFGSGTPLPENKAVAR